MLMQYCDATLGQVDLGESILARTEALSKQKTLATSQEHKLIETVFLV